MIEGERPHLDDSVLLAALDGEALPATRTHIETCRTCSGRLDRLDADIRTTSVLLAHVQLPPGFRLPALPRPHARPLHRWSRTQLRAAAGILLLLFAAGVPSARAWMIERAEGILAAMGGVLAPDTSPATDEKLATAEGSALLFVPGQGALEIAVEQPSGTLRLGTTVDAQARVEIMGGDGTDELVRTPTGVRIRNSPTSTAGYEITVPAAVTAVHVRIGDRLWIVPVKELRAGALIDLCALQSRQPG